MSALTYRTSRPQEGCESAEQLQANSKISKHRPLSLFKPAAFYWKSRPIPPRPLPALRRAGCRLGSKDTRRLVLELRERTPDSDRNYFSRSWRLVGPKFRRKWERRGLGEESGAATKFRETFEQFWRPR